MSPAPDGATVVLAAKAGHNAENHNYPERDREGFRLRPDGESLGIMAEVSSNQQARIDTLELIKGYWADVGIRMTVKSEDRSLLYERKDANEWNMAVRGGDGGMDVILEPRWYFPYSHESDFAMAWQQWYNSGGKEGMEPPEAAKQQMALYDQLKVTVGTEAQDEIMKEILQIAQEQFWSMGSYRTPPGYEICKNKFRNVPNPNLGSWLYPNPGPQHPAQYFWEE